MLKWGHAVIAAGFGITIYACSGLSEANAADMPFYGDPAPQTKVEFGTGWYIRGDIAYANEAAPVLPNTDLSGRLSAMSLGLGFGYKFNNWIRADLVGDYRSPYKSYSTGTSKTCITQLTTIAFVPTTTATDDCSPHNSASVRQWDLLQNVYVDLGTWYGVTPYIGAGAGLSFTRTTTTTKWYMSNGVPYQVTTDGFYYNWDTNSSIMSYKFAWAIMAGAAYQLSDNAFLDIGYRYVNLGTFTTTSSSGASVTKKDDVQEFRVGVRYMID